jgi:hypothetical protein
MPASPWLALEAIPSLAALPAVWKGMVGAQFQAFSSLCLQPSSLQVRTHPCPRACGCNHALIPRHDGTGAVAVCRCNPPSCPDILLTALEITPLEVSRPRLGRALCKAFGFTQKFAEMPVPTTFQFGAWSANAVPALLTIQVQNSNFRRAVAELAAQLRIPFILFAPTSDFLDAPSQAILQNLHAGFFALDNLVVLTGHGTLQPTSPPAQLFIPFNPQPKEFDLDLAQRVFALVRNLDTEKPLRPPSLLAVFRHYCIEELSSSQIARKYACSKPSILRRLALIRARTGADPQHLRRLSPHIAKLQDNLADPRAAHIHPASHLQNDDEPDA